MRRGEISVLAGAGLLLGIAVVVSWGRLGPEPGSVNPTRWFGFLAAVAPDDASKARLLYVLIPAISLLMLAWWHVQRMSLGGRLSTRSASLVAACWAVPFALGPVIASRDAYAYVAQGQLARQGFDPARAVVSQLGPGALLSAVDPRWRDTRPPYGGVAVAIQKAAAGAGSPGLSLLVLRLIAVVAVVVLVVVAASMVTPSRRPIAITAIAANPLVLLHLVAGAHLDAVAAALLVGGLALAVRAPGREPPSEWRHVSGVVLCGLAAMVKLPAGLGAAFLMALGFAVAGPGLWRRLRSVAIDLLAIVAAVGLSMALSQSGLGWLRNFDTPGRLRTGIAPADIGANLISALAWLVGLHPASSSVLDAARGLAAALAVVLAAVLLLPRAQRIGDGQRRWRSPTLDQLGLALLAMALLGPVLYGWYLAPALPLLAIAASRARAGRGELAPPVAQALIFLLSVVLTFATAPTLEPVWRTLRSHPASLVVVSVVVLAGLVTAAIAWRGASRRARESAEPRSALPPREPSLQRSL